MITIKFSTRFRHTERRVVKLTELVCMLDRYPQNSVDDTSRKLFFEDFKICENIMNNFFLAIEIRG